VSNDCIRTLQRIVVVGVLLILFLVVALFIYSKKLKHSAEKVVRVSYELSQRESSPTLEDLRQRLGTQLRQSAACTDSGCGYEVTLSNRLLFKLRLAPYTALRSSFWVRDNVLEENVVEVFTVNRRGGMVVYVDAKYCEECNDFDIVSCVGATASVGSGSVRIGSRSRPVDKQVAFGFKTECLSSLRGCASVAELLPTIWSTTSDGTLQCASSDH
jgi:hypothetical protein